MKLPIYEVTNVETTLQANLLRVEAGGEVPQTGWSGGELRLDGQAGDALIFTFVATPPAGIVMPLFTPIEAEPFEIPLMPIVPKYVIVRAAQNEIRVAIGKQLVYEVTGGVATGRGNVLTLSSKGVATSNDWTEPELVLQRDRYEYWFMAKPGGSIPVLTGIEAGPEETLVKLPFPDRVTIKARTSSLDVRVEAAGKKPIAHLDAARAKLTGNTLYVEAHGETETNGWTDPELRVIEEGDTYVLEFVATAPELANAVITPISAKAQFGPLEPPFPSKVAVRSASNEMTVDVELTVLAPEEAPKVPVYRVNEVVAKLDGNTVRTKAEGTVVSSGWKAPELRFEGRSRDTLIYTFVARRPGGITRPVLEDIAAEATSGPERPPFPLYVLVKAGTNSKRVAIQQGTVAPQPSSKPKQARV